MPCNDDGDEDDEGEDDDDNHPKGNGKEIVKYNYMS